MSTPRAPSAALAAPWRRALVVGLGRSGRAAAAVLHALGVQTWAYDANPTASATAGVRTFLDPTGIPDAALEAVDLVVLSPGVPPAHTRERVAACAPGAEIHGELGLALSLLERADLLPTLCLVTGTNGKSTITALVGHLLAHAGRTVFTGGNLGVPLCEVLLEIVRGQAAPDFAVLECSSYQLETLPRVRTAVAILSNLSPDHLARYESLEHYARTKAAVFCGLGFPHAQPQGLALLDGEDPWTTRLAPTADRVGQVQCLFTPGGPHLDGDALCLPSGLSFSRSDLRIAGRHNAKNALFALAAAEAMGVAHEALTAGLRSFEGLSHRMAFVREHRDIAYYNDSKATNVASTLAGMAGFERPFVLLCGGQLKGDPLEPLMQVVASQGRGMVAFGEGAAALLSAARGRFAVETAPDLEAALVLARALALPGDAVVLSPAGASWDAYENFAARGDHFVELVSRL